MGPLEKEGPAHLDGAPWSRQEWVCCAHPQFLHDPGESPAPLRASVGLPGCMRGAACGVDALATWKFSDDMRSRACLLFAHVRRGEGSGAVGLRVACKEVRLWPGRATSPCALGGVVLRTSGTV